MRTALLGGDWDGLEAALRDASGRVVADIGAPELRLAQDELDNRTILLEISSALQRGRPQGRPGRLYIGAVDTRPLEASLDLAARLGPKTAEAQQMLFSGKVIARLRACLLNEDLRQAAITLEAMQGQLLASVAVAEARAVQDEVDNWVLIAELSGALTTAGPGGVVGALDLSGVGTARLEAAVPHAEEIGVKTPEAASLLAAAKLVLRLRSALLQVGRGRGREGSSSRCGARADSFSPPLAGPLDR